MTGKEKMKANYIDITSRIKDKICWYDENGTPRYCKFHPKHLPNIYAREGILLEIQCQYCGDHFLIGIGQKNWPGNKSFSQFIDEWTKKDKEGCLYYDDPPIHDCIGDTMTVDTLRIVEFWIRNSKTNLEWRRKKKYEIEIV